MTPFCLFSCGFTINVMCYYYIVVIASTQVYSRIFLLIFLMLHNDIICSILHHRRRRCVLVYFLTVIPWFYTFIMPECGKTTVKRFVRIILFVLVWNGSIIRVRKLSNLVHRCNIRRGGPPTRRPSIMAVVSTSIVKMPECHAMCLSFKKNCKCKICAISRKEHLVVAS